MWFHTAALIGFVAGALATAAQAADYPRGDLLVEPSELATPELRTSVVILDTRERAQYDTGHVPRARWVNHGEWSKKFGDGDDTAGWSKRLGNLGLDSTTNAVVYDDNSSKDAARIWWILRYWGIEKARLLNGGWHGWKAAGLETENRTTTFANAMPELVPASKRLATKELLLKSLNNESLQIVDARSEIEFCGIEALNNKRAGAIPGAKHLEWSDLIERESQRFKSAAELKRLFEAAAIDLGRPTATHCQSGGRSSVMAFGLELMGVKDVSNYYRSWSEWGNSTDTPVAPGKPR